MQIQAAPRRLLLLKLDQVDFAAATECFSWFFLRYGLFFFLTYGICRKDVGILAHVYELCIGAFENIPVDQKLETTATLAQVSDVRCA